MADLVTVASDAARYFETARRATGDTETGPREDGDLFIRLTDGAPEWVTDLVRDAHCDMLPDDWRYQCIRDAVDWIAEGNDPHNSGEFADSQVDIYTHDRLKWLESHERRVGYCDDAIEEYGLVPEGGIIESIGYGQYAEAWEVFGMVLNALEDRVAAQVQL